MTKCPSQTSKNWWFLFSKFFLCRLIWTVRDCVRETGLVFMFERSWLGLYLCLRESLTWTVPLLERESDLDCTFVWERVWLGLYLCLRKSDMYCTLVLRERKTWTVPMFKRVWLGLYLCLKERVWLGLYLCLKKRAWPGLYLCLRGSDFYCTFV